MKLQVTLATVLFYIVAGVAVASSVEYVFGLPKSSYSFTLMATGQAYDPSQHGHVVVALSACGTAHKECTEVAHLHIRGGDVDVDFYGTFSVIKGEGILIPRLHYILLIIEITPLYGGHKAVWILRGSIRDVSNTLQVSLVSNGVILPLPYPPKLSNLQLQGTITPD